MTDYTKLIERLREYRDSAEAAQAIEALRAAQANQFMQMAHDAVTIECLNDKVMALLAENERLKAERNALQSKLVAMGKGEPLTDERQPLTKVLAAVREYLPPDGISAKDCLSKIIAIVDPWPLDSKPLIAIKDVELSLMAHNDDPGDWNDLGYRDSWHEGYKAGARATETEHGIGGAP